MKRTFEVQWHLCSYPESIVLNVYALFTVTEKSKAFAFITKGILHRPRKMF